MRSRLSILLLFSLLTAAPAPSAEGQPTGLPERMAAIRTVADGYPPKIDGPAERERVAEMWRALERDLLSYVASASAPDANAELLLGDLYRMGYNLDIEGSGDKTILHLERAISLMPTNFVPHLTLGRHYTHSVQYEAGEIQLLRAHLLAPPEQSSAILFELTINYYYQKNFHRVVVLADRFLAIHPDVESIRFLREKSLESIEQGTVPRTITIETDELPDGKLKTKRGADPE